MRSEEQSAQTRGRVIGAARRLLVEAGYHRLGLEAVAKEAGVTRATVYYQFHSKLGLLAAILADAETRTPVPGLPGYSDDGPPDPGAFLASSCTFWAANEDVVRNVIALAALDEDVRALTSERDAHRRAEVTKLVRRFKAELLCPEPKAIDALWLLSSFSAFDILRTGPPRRTVPQVVEVLSALSAGVVNRGRESSPG